MPWIVTPSKSVDVKCVPDDDELSIEPKDLLELEFRDDSRMYVRKSSCDHHQVIDKQLMPPLFQEYVDHVVERVLQCTGATKTRIDRVFAQCADKTLSLETYVYHRVCHEALVSAVVQPGTQGRWRSVNIGDQVRVQIAPYAGDWRLPYGIQNWVADSEVVDIRPITRSQALVNFQAYRSPGQAWPELESTTSSDQPKATRSDGFED